jgi:hypothetical protein
LTIRIREICFGDTLIISSVPCRGDSLIRDEIVKRGGKLLQDKVEKGEGVDERKERSEKRERREVYGERKKTHLPRKVDDYHTSSL